MGLTWALTSEGAHAEEARAGLICVRAADFLHGALELTEGSDGWVRPERFTARQRRALSSCLAWHPGLFRQMAQATAGVCLRFVTDACSVVVALRLDAESEGTAAVLRSIDRGGPRRMHDGVSGVCDARPLGVREPEVVRRPIPWIEGGEQGIELVEFELEQDDPANDGVATMHLPGLGLTHEVVLWLPMLRGCAVRELWADGTFLEPVDTRPRLVVLGDSIAQGFCTDDPALAWPVLLAERLDLDLLNLSVGGQVFQPTMLADLSIEDAPYVVVALGENYRFEHCSTGEVARDARAFLSEVMRRVPTTRLLAVSPLWHDEEASPSNPMSPWREISWEEVLTPRVRRGQEASVSYVDGSLLCEHDSDLFADGEHPTAAGAALVARRLELALRRTDDQVELVRRAEEVLAAGPARVRPLYEALRHALAEVVWADEGCVLLRLPDGMELVYAPDHEKGADVCALWSSRHHIQVFEPGLQDELAELLGLGHRSPFCLCFFEGDDAPEVPAQWADAIRVLDESYIDAIISTYSLPQLMDERVLRQALRDGRFLGAFVDDELVGYVGEHPEGSMGYLVVLRAHRKQGIGYALMASKICSLLEEGRLPWSQTYPHNRASLALQRKLGLTVLPAQGQCFLYGE